MKALIFDCDGVLVDTERDGHRRAFNRAFARKGLKAKWSVDIYGQLLAIAGGKERMPRWNALPASVEKKLIPGDSAQ